MTSTVTWRRMRGMRGTYGTGLALVARLIFGDAAQLCVARVALGDIDLPFAWQAWHLVTSTCTLRGRRGAYGTGLALVTRVGPACRPLPQPFARQAWHLVTSTCTLRGRCGAYGTGMALVARLGPNCRRCRGLLRGRRGTWRQQTSFCVAGVALGDIGLPFAWQAWHSRHWAGSSFVWQAWHLATSTFTLCGRALTALGWLWWRCCRGRLSGRRGAW